MKFDIITIFPKMVEAGLAEGVIGRGIERELLDVHVHDLRGYTTDRHRSVDDVPYGGGPGMVMKPEPLARAVDQDELLKTLDLEDYREYKSEYWRSHTMRMVNHQTGKSTDLIYKDFDFGIGLGDRDFAKGVLARLQ